MSRLEPINALDANSSLAQLMLKGNKQKLPKKHNIQFSDERMMLCYLKSGYIKRYLITDEGYESVQSIYGPGEIFPLTPVFKAIFGRDIYYGDEIFFYTSVNECEIYFINKDTLIEAIEKDPLIYKDLLQVAGLRLYSNIHRLENTSLKAANKQVAELLVYYSNRFGKPTNDGIEIQLPLTHELIGSVLNLARETVTHVISRLTKLNLIKSDKKIIVIDLLGLKNYSR